MKKNVLISSNYNPLYIQFVPLIATVWRKWGFNPILTLITNKDYNEWKWIEDYCEVRYWNVRKDISESVWSKLSRIITYPLPIDEKQMVSDIDMIPLNKKYFENLFDYDENKLVLASSDSHKNAPIPEGGPNHKFAGCYMVAKGKIWKEIINPKNLGYEELINSFKGIKKYDHKEDIQNSNTFSEESLIRSLVYTWNPLKDKIIMLNRGWNQLANNRIDRAMNDVLWKKSLTTLNQNKWIDCHSKRPINRYYDLLIPIVEYLNVDKKLLDEGIKRSN